MTSHELAKILLSKPNAPAVVWVQKFYDLHELREVHSVAYTNSGHFTDSKGDDGDNGYNSGRECIEIK